MANTMEEFEALLNESFEIDTPAEGSVVKGKVIAIEAGQAIIDVGYNVLILKNLQIPVKRLNWPLATLSKCSCVKLKTPKAKPSFHVKWPAAKKLGIVSKKPMLTKNVLMARSLAALKVGSLLTLAARLRSCPALRLTFALYAMQAH